MCSTSRLLPCCGRIFNGSATVDWIEPLDLQRATDDFVRFVEDYARLHDIPLVPAQPKESHVDKAAEYLDRVADQERAVYCIIKVQEENLQLRQLHSQNGRRTRNARSPGRRRVNHYYFFLKDPEFAWATRSGFPAMRPSQSRLFNGHHFVAQYLRSRGVGFQMCDNMIVAVDDPKAFRRAIQALTPRAIERFCDDWVVPTDGLRSHHGPSVRASAIVWFLDQVEYSHNLIFREKDKLNALFGRLLDRGRQIAQPHVIARLFHRQRLRTQRTGGRVQRTREEDYVLKAWHKKTNIKQYNKHKRRSLRPACAPKPPATTYASSAPKRACATFPTCCVV